MARKLLTVLSALFVVLGLMLAPFTPAIAASAVATVTSTVYTVSSGGTPSENITNVPFSTSNVTFLAALTMGGPNQSWNGTGIANPVLSGNTLVVTAEDGTTTVTYTVTVNPASIVATVTSASYAVSAGGTSNETIAGVPFNTPQAAFLAALTKGEPNQTWDAAGIAATVVSGNTLVVTAQDGTTRVTYTVTVSAASADANLSNLVLSAGTLTPAFSSNSTSYTANVTNAVNSVVVTPTVRESHATVTVNGLPPSAAVALGVGANLISVLVTAQDGTTRSYTVTVTRAASSVATVTSASYTVSAGGTASETIMGIPFSTSNVTFLAALTKGESNQTWDATGIAATVVSGNTLVVTAQDQTTRVTYTVTIAPPSTGPSLSNLSISAGTLTPAFSANTTGYTAGVANAVSSVTVTPTVSDNSTTIRVNGTAVAGGTPSLPIALSVGGNVITIQVTSQNVTGVPPYTVTVTRAALAMAISSVSPSSGPTTGGTSITITGTGFTGASAVTIGGTAAVFSVTDDAHIGATTPPGTAGARDVTVTKPGGSATGPGAFTYVASPPAGGDGGGGGGGFAGGGGGVPASPGETGLGAFTNSDGLFNLAGTAVSQDGAVKLAFGRGVLAKDKNGSALRSVSILPLADPPAPPADSRMIGLVYELGPAGAVFKPAITLTFSYDPSKLPAGFEERNLVLATWDATAGKWVELATTVDPLTQTVTVSIEHFSVYGIIAHARPASFAVSGLIIAPGTVDIGKPVGISVTVRNDGNLGGSYRVALLVNGALESTRDLQLSGGGTETVTFPASRAGIGTYAVDLNGLTGSFTVRPPLVAGVAAFETRDLSVSPTSVKVGDRVTVSFAVTNTGQAGGTYHAALKVRGSVTETVVTETKNVALEPGAGQTVTFVIVKTSPGTYGIEADRLFGAFEVKPAETGGQSVVGRWLITGIALVAAAAMVAGFWLARRRRVADGPRPGG